VAAALAATAETAITSSIQLVQLLLVLPVVGLVGLLAKLAWLGCSHSRPQRTPRQPQLLKRSVSVVLVREMLLLASLKMWVGLDYWVVVLLLLLPFQLAAGSFPGPAGW
jgi:hypothetical protein